MTMDATAILTGAMGEYLGGLAGALTLRFLEVCGSKVKKSFSAPPREKALKESMAVALLSMVRGISEDADDIKHYLGVFGDWMQRELVAEELSQVVDPRPDAVLDMKLLRDEFEKAGYDPRWLGEGVSLNACVERFIEAFADAAAAEPELQEPIKIGLLKGLATSAHEIADANREQVEILRRIEARVALIEYRDGKFLLNSAMIHRMVDFTTTADPRYTPNRVKREARKIKTREMYESWRKKYRQLKRSKPGQSDRWYAFYISRMGIADGRDVETIRKITTVPTLMSDNGLSC